MKRSGSRENVRALIPDKKVACQFTTKARFPGIM